jgi:CheY-like chemotaxis protein
MPHILLIDDDDFFRGMVRKSLEGMGHTVTVASDGRQGVAVYKSKPADLVITDLIMPEQEGLETIMELRRLHPGLKIIAISGGGRASAKDYLPVAKKLGASRILAKPFSPETLGALIEELLAEKFLGSTPAEKPGGD